MTQVAHVGNASVEREVDTASRIVARQVKAVDLYATLQVVHALQCHLLLVKCDACDIDSNCRHLIDNL